MPASPHLHRQEHRKNKLVTRMSVTYRSWEECGKRLWGDLGAHAVYNSCFYDLVSDLHIQKIKSSQQGCHGGD